MGRKHYKHRAPTLKLQCVIFWWSLGGVRTRWMTDLPTSYTVYVRDGSILHTPSLYIKLRYFSSIIFVMFFPSLQVRPGARKQRRSTTLTVLIKMWQQIAFRCSTLGTLTLAGALAQERPNPTVDLSNSYAVRDLLGIDRLESALRKPIWRGLGRKRDIHLLKSYAL